MEQEIQMEQEPIQITTGGAVNSVNGQTGDVVLTTSDLENTSDYQTGDEVESAISTAVATEANERQTADTALNNAISAETTARQTADNGLQSQIDAITASSDVTDIVGTYAQLQAYDTSTLGDNDIIKVLQDESQNDETTYYRWSTTAQSFTLIGEEGPYYTKSQTDTLLDAKQNTLTAGKNITIIGDAISANGGVVELTTADYNYPVDNPTQIAAWLLDDGIYSTKNVSVWWSTSSGNSNVIFVKGTDGSSRPYALVMSRDNTILQQMTVDGSGLGTRILLTRNDITDSLTSTSTIKALSANQGKVLKDLVDSLAVRGAGAPTTSTIGAVGTLYEDTTNGDLYICTDATNPYVWEKVGGGPTVVQTTGTSTTAVMSQKATTSMVYADPGSRRQIQIGANAVSSAECVAIGEDSTTTGQNQVAIGRGAIVQNAGARGCIALGDKTVNTSAVNGVMSIGPSSTNYGYNTSTYRLLTGLYDPQNAHDAANKQYVDNLIAALEARIAALEGN